jgi:hypothetical protein
MIETSVAPASASAIPRSAVLRLKIDLAAPVLRSALSVYWRSDNPADRYLSYLRTMHTVLRASVPLMELAASRCTDLADRDPAAGPLRAYLVEHIAEERHHDAWIAEDLRATGADPGTLSSAQPTPVVAALAGAQYYWINHHHPVCLLGYIAVLEGHAPPPGLAARLQSMTGYPAEAFRTLSHHADVDGAHTAQLYRLLDSLPLSASQDSAVGVSALHAAAALTELFTEHGD